MIYKVRAKYKTEKLSEFYTKLSDGSISDQKPDGEEIVASMKRAKITKPGMIEWFEKCHCSRPLKHEKETVYDFYLYEMSTAVVEDYGEVAGLSFWSYLETVP